MTYNIEDFSRLDYSRVFWRGKYREALLASWLRPEHPYRRSFIEHRVLVEGLLECEDPEAYAATLARDGWSLRTLIRLIPPIFPDWFREERRRCGLK